VADLKSIQQFALLDFSSLQKSLFIGVLGSNLTEGDTFSFFVLKIKEGKISDFRFKK
jgi:hypothetical protein